MLERLKRLLKVGATVHTNNRILMEIHKTQVFQSASWGCPWLKDRAFAPGGWAVDAAVLYTLYRVLNDVRPASIIEFGLGQSSRLIYQYKNAYPQVEAMTVEHDLQWVEFFKMSLNNSYDVNVRHTALANVQYKGKDTLSYEGMDKLAGDKKFDLILVDGPFGSDHYSRSQVISLVESNLSPSFCIIIDDYNRAGEKETHQEISRILKEKKIEHLSKVYSGEKDHVLICSANWKFLSTL